MGNKSPVISFEFDPQNKYKGRLLYAAETDCKVILWPVDIWKPQQNPPRLQASEYHNVIANIISEIWNSNHDFDVTQFPNQQYEKSRFWSRWHSAQQAN